MSQTRVWTIPKVNNSRTTDAGGSGQGAGALDTVTVGRTGASGTRRNYTGYMRPTTNWTGVKTLRTAVLTVTTASTFAGAHDDPRVTCKRLTANFTEGSAAGFASSDYVHPSSTSSGQVVAHMDKVEGNVTNIDITDIVKSWAPGTVAGGTGTVTAADLRNHGIGLYGSTDQNEDWIGYSDDADNPGNAPYITITYEEGATIPDAPSNASPVGSVASLVAFEADFVDSRATDTLAATEVDFYANNSEKTGTAATSNVVSVASHGYSVGDRVRFTVLTGGAGLSLGVLYYVKTAPSSGTFTVSTAPGGTTVDITTAYTTIKVRKVLWRVVKTASETEKTADHSFVLPDGLHPTRNVPYAWRMRQKDQEGQWSPWLTALTVTVTNDDPNDPTGLTPDADGTPAAVDFDSLLGVWFRAAAFTDLNAGDYLLAFQVQMSTLPEGDVGWDDASSLKWDTGKRYVAADTDIPEVQYGGADLLAGTYYWRLRWWDQHDGLSDWAYARIVLLNDFDPEPGTQSAIQTNPHAPWRIRIREMKFNSLAPVMGAITGVASTNVFTSANDHDLVTGLKVRFTSITGGAGLIVGKDYWVITSGLGAKTFKVSETLAGAAVDFTTNVTAAVLTSVTTRGPGNVVGILEDAKSVGGSIVFNSPGEAHFTLPVDHPQISVIEPKQVHYGIDFYTGDGWRETYAGLVWDLDANEQDAVFPCLDYMALTDMIQDERYDPARPDLPYTLGGSKYVATAISTIVTNQLQYATGLANSPVGFISIGTIDSMTEKLTVWSTMQPTLSFISSLLDSHRQGTGKKTRLKVRRTNVGGYEYVVEDAPGQTRDNLRLRYGEMVNGYHVVVFGNNWSDRVNGVGRTREGLRVMYKSADAPGISQRVWGRFARAVLVDNVNDENDLSRRLKQMAIKNGKFGQGVAVAIRTGLLRPRDGYDVTDDFPVVIQHGAVNTDNYGSTYYTCWAIGWEAGDDGSQEVTLTLTPREDTVAPDTDLIDASPLSLQAEWQVGWVPPVDDSYHQVLLSMDTLLIMDDDDLMDTYLSPTTGRFHIDITTGIISELQPDGTWAQVSAPPTVPKQDEAGVVPETRTVTGATGFSTSSVKVRVR